MTSATSDATATGAIRTKNRRSQRTVSDLMYAAQQGDVEKVRKIIYEQADSTSTYVHDIWNKYSLAGKINKKTRHLQFVSLRLLNTKLQFTAMGFFNLDWTFCHMPSKLLIRDRTGKSPLHYCSTSDNICAAQAADLLVMAAPELVESQDEDGFTPLHLAVIAGNMSLVTFLLANKADVNAVDNEKHTVVHWATVCGETSALRAVLAAGAPVSTPDVHGGFPLHYAAQMCGGDKDPQLGLQVLQTLLTHTDISVSVQDEDGRQPLLWAASAGSAKAVLALVRAGASVEAPDKDGLTALHCAASRGHTDCIDSLLTLCGASPDVIDSNGCTALHYAVTLGHADATALLLAHGADPNRQDRKGRSPAHCGCAKGQFETVKMIGAHNANLWLRNARGDLPLHEAAASGRRDLVRWLLDMRPSQVNARNNDGRCPLHLAALNDNADMCKILLDAGAQINPVLRTSKNTFMTPLDCALQRGFRSTAKYLQLHGGIPATRLKDKKVAHGESARFQDKLHFKLWNNSSSDSERENGDNSKLPKKVQRKKLSQRYEKKIVSLSGSDIENSKLPSSKLTEKNRPRYQERSDSGTSVEQRHSSRKTQSGRFDYTNEIVINGNTEINIHQTKQITLSPRSDADNLLLSENLLMTENIDNIISEKNNKRPKSAKFSKSRDKSAKTIGKVDSAKQKIKTLRSNSKVNIAEQGILEQSSVDQATTINNNNPLVPDSDLQSTKQQLLDEQSIMSCTSEDAEVHKNIVVEAAIHQPPNINTEKKITTEQNLPKVESQAIGVQTELSVNNSAEDNHDAIKENERNNQTLNPDKSTTLDNKAEANLKITASDDTNSIFGPQNTQNTGEQLKSKEQSTAVKAGDKANIDLSSKIEPNLEAAQDQKLFVQNEDEKKSNKTSEVKDSLTELATLQQEEQKLDQETSEAVQAPDTGNTKPLVEQNNLTFNNTENTVITSEIKHTNVENLEKADLISDKNVSQITMKNIDNVIENTGALETNEEPVKLKHRKHRSKRQKNDKAYEIIYKTVATDEDALDAEKFLNGKQKKSSEEESSNSISESSNTSCSTSQEHKSFKVLNEEETNTVDSVKMNSKRKTETHKQRSRSEEYEKNQQKNKTLLSKSNLSKSDKCLNISGKKLVSELESRIPSLPNINENKNQMRSQSNLSAPLPDSNNSDHEKASDSDLEEDDNKSSTTRKRKVKRKTKTRESKSAGSDYESSNVIDSGIEPSPRSSRLPKWRNMSERGVNMSSVTQSIQSNIRRYHLERKIFQHLLELKRLQIRAGQHNEAILVKRAIDAYHQSCAATVGAGKYIPEDYTFKSFEKFLYLSLRKLQRNGADHLKGLPESSTNPLLCTQSTHRCMHATHAYTGIPCAAYLPRMDHHSIPKIGFTSNQCKPGTGGFLPTIGQKKAVTLELCHGTDKQVISLPADKLDQNKRYYVTFTVKGSESTPPNEETNGHLHAKSD